MLGWVGVVMTMFCYCFFLILDSLMIHPNFSPIYVQRLFFPSCSCSLSCAFHFPSLFLFHLHTQITQFFSSLFSDSMFPTQKLIRIKKSFLFSNPFRREIMENKCQLLLPQLQLSLVVHFTDQTVPLHQHVTLPNLLFLLFIISTPYLSY